MGGAVAGGPLLLLDQHKIAAPDFPRSPEWWARFLPGWMTAEHRDGGIVALDVTGQAHPSQGPRPVEQVRRNQRTAALRFLFGLPQLEPAIVEDTAPRCQCWRLPGAALHGGHCCFSDDRVCHALPENIRADGVDTLLAMSATWRRVAALDRRYRQYAIKFALDSDAEPTDAKLKRILDRCARPARAGEYPEIRRRVVLYRADPEGFARQADAGECPQ
jgi:hypothetical protein